MSARCFEPVTIRLPGAPAERRIASAFEALECLVTGWPILTGPVYRRAVRACRDALDGVVRPDVARRAFVAAAAEIAHLSPKTGPSGAIPRGRLEPGRLAGPLAAAAAAMPRRQDNAAAMPRRQDNAARR